MFTRNEPAGQAVQTPPCLVQNEQVQARAGISDGSGTQLSENDMLPQWHFPEISTELPRLSSLRLDRCYGRRLGAHQRSIAAQSAARNAARSKVRLENLSAISGGAACGHSA